MKQDMNSRSSKWNIIERSDVIEGLCHDSSGEWWYIDNEDKRVCCISSKDCNEERAIELCRSYLKREEEKLNASVEVKSFNMKDMDIALKEKELPEDCNLETITTACLRNYNIILAVNKKTLELVVKTGRLLNRAKIKIGHGGWENYCKDKLGVGNRGGYSAVTIWRWRKLAEWYDNNSSKKDYKSNMTLHEAYVKAGLIAETQKQWEVIYETIVGYTEFVEELQCKFIRRVEKYHCQEIDTIDIQELSEVGCCHIYEAEIEYSRIVKEFASVLNSHNECVTNNIKAIGKYYNDICKRRRKEEACKKKRIKAVNDNEELTVTEKCKRSRVIELENKWGDTAEF